MTILLNILMAAVLLAYMAFLFLLAYRPDIVASLGARIRKAKWRERFRK